MTPPPAAGLSAGIVLSLARQEYPDTSAYTAPEIVRRIRKRHHAGLIVASPDAERVTRLLDEHVSRFYADFHASAPAPERPVELTCDAGWTASHVKGEGIREKGET